MAKTTQKPKEIKSVDSKMQFKESNKEQILSGNVDDAIQKAIAELEKMQKDIRAGKSVSLERVDFMSKLLQDGGDKEAAW